MSLGNIQSFNFCASSLTNLRNLSVREGKSLQASSLFSLILSSKLLLLNKTIDSSSSNELSHARSLTSSIKLPWRFRSLIQKISLKCCSYWPLRELFFKRSYRNFSIFGKFFRLLSWQFDIDTRLTFIKRSRNFLSFSESSSMWILSKISDPSKFSGVWSWLSKSLSFYSRSDICERLILI